MLGSALDKGKAQDRPWLDRSRLRESRGISTILDSLQGCFYPCYHKYKDQVAAACRCSLEGSREGRDRDEFLRAFAHPT